MLRMRLEAIGILPQKVKQFEKRGIDSVESLLRFYPAKYRDYRHPVLIRDLSAHDGENVVVKGVAYSCKVIQAKHTMLRLQDKSGIFSVFFFNQPYRAKYIRVGTEYVVGGTVHWDNQYSSATFSTPDCFEVYREDVLRLVPVYRKIPGMSEDYLMDSIAEALRYLTECSKDYLSNNTRKKLGVMSIHDTILAAHFPKDEADIEAVHRRVIVDELYPFCEQLEEKRRNAAKMSPFRVKTPELILDTLLSQLPYSLTHDQKAALDKLVLDMKAGKRVDALVQGDVGCGKTVVAILTAAVMANEGFQTVVMCPTAVLARQHFESFSQLLAPAGIQVSHLYGGMKARERKETLESIRSNQTNVIIGTHSVFSSDVEYGCLGLVIVDEEHRFGVAQRECLKEKASEGVHTISMSATPIPRSIAVTVFGEGTDIINIHTMPSGRKPVKTILYSNEEKVYQSMYNQIREGRQCYVLCPLIEDSDSDLLEGVESVDSTVTKLTQWFARYPEVKIQSITGDMKAEDVQKRIAEFSSGSADILVSTTIVEVGVNIPNATVMLIKNAERFGLAQLHQLRGRVGRSSYQGYCVLLSDQKDNERLRTMVATNDGFEIAQKDLELRGTGQILGTRQSGADKYIDLMLRNQQLYHAIRQQVAEDKRKEK